MRKLTEKEIASGFERIFAEANFRTVEVAKILGVHRVTASNYRFRGIGNCDASTFTRICLLIQMVNYGLKHHDLPLDTETYIGSKARMAAYFRIIKKFKASFAQ